MEELLYFLLILVIGIFLVVPIVMLVKITTLNKRVNNLDTEAKELNKRITHLLSSGATKEDVHEILDAIAKGGGVQAESVTEKIIVSQPPIEEKITPPIFEGIKKEEPPKIIDIPIPEFIPKPVTGIVEEKIKVEETVEAPQKEELIEFIDKEEEIVPSYAAAIKPVEAKIVVEPTTVPPPSPPTFKVKDEDKEPEKSIIEKIFGENWLSKVGIVTLVLGIGFFVKYAIDQEWINEMGRVAIGLLTGGIIIGIAHKLKSKFHVFSSILVGGGISVFYITITLAFREYEIFTQPVAFGLLVAVTIFSVILSLYYNRQELAIFSLIGGVLAPLMISSGTGNYIILFSYMLILNTGMLVISLKKNWNSIGVIAYVFSLIFFWGWLLFEFENEYLGATLFASLFFVQFYILAIIKHFREGKKMSIFQAILILTNNLSILLACMYIFNSYVPDVRGLATIAIAVVNAVVMMTLFRQSKVDKNMIYLIIAVVMSFVSLAVPIQLRGYVITMFWAAESVLLLWLWQKSRINVFRLGFLIISALVIISYLMDVEHSYGYAFELSAFSNRIFITGIVLLISYVLNIFILRKENKEDQITVRGGSLFSVGSLITLLKFMFVILLFMVPYLELNHQLRVYTDTDYISSFRYLSMATYTMLFIAGLAIVSKNKMGAKRYYFFLVSVILYALIYIFLVIDMRSDIYLYDIYPTSYFSIHFLSLLAMGYVIYALVKNIRLRQKSSFKVLCWILVILSVVILSVELDNIIIFLFGNADNYNSLLYDVHTFGYPILWGLLAMVLMIWGLKKREVTLRKISLISFGLIIAKFYAYDVWHMSQGGRIVSFVLLGVILLSVSFMQQKIKTLVKEDKEIPTQPEDKEI